MTLIHRYTIHNLKRRNIPQLIADHNKNSYKTVTEKEFYSPTLTMMNENGTKFVASLSRSNDAPRVWCYIFLSHVCLLLSRRLMKFLTKAAYRWWYSLKLVSNLPMSQSKAVLWKDRSLEGRWTSIFLLWWNPALWGNSCSCYKRGAAKSCSDAKKSHFGNRKPYFG